MQMTRKEKNALIRAIRTVIKAGGECKRSVVTHSLACHTSEVRLSTIDAMIEREIVKSRVSNAPGRGRAPEIFTLTEYGDFLLRDMVSERE